MDIWISNLPAGASSKELEKLLREHLKDCGVDAFYVDKKPGKTFAFVTVQDTDSGLRFLSRYGLPENSRPGVRATRRLLWGNRLLYCRKSNKEADDYSVKAVAYEASQRAAKSSTVVTHQVQGTQNPNITRFAIQGLQCGTWGYSGTQLAFIQHFRDGRQGSVSLGRNGVVILLGGSGSNQCRIDLSYHDCDNIILGGYDSPTITFTLLKIPPKFYEIIGEDVLAAALLSMTLGPRAAGLKTPKKTRLTSINDEHAKVAGQCFVYRITLSDYTRLSAVRGLLTRNPKMPSTVSISTSALLPTESLSRSFVRLNHQLTDTGLYGNLPFNILYQLFRLAQNGVLSPLRVIELLPKVSDIFRHQGLDATQSALRRFYRHVPFPGPDTESDALSKNALELMLDEFAHAYNEYQYNPEDPFRLFKRHTHINLIHKVVVTPAGMFLEGPEPEPTNRVLRRYADTIDNFIRVVFQDEDGCSVRYDPRASQHVIFHERFKQVLDGIVPLLIAGRAFSFLGFSHSSLRAQSCWFMAPIFRDNSLRLTQHVLKDLGDFSNIKVPAKCAARIGQNFTDT